MLKQSLQQKLLQKLSPQQIQMIKLLEVPTIQLEQRIKKELEENPALEEGVESDDYAEEDSYEDTKDDKEQDEFSLEDYLNDEDIPSYKLNSSNYSKDDKNEDIPFSVGNSFAEHLFAQLGLRSLTEQQENIAKYIIGNLDEDGYLRRELEAIVNDLAFSQNIMTSKEDLENILAVIQDLEPSGVGARDLRECLLLQINALQEITPEIELAKKILDLYFEEFTKKHYDKILSRLNISNDELKDAIYEIVRLNPKPGGSYADQPTKVLPHIIPDFLLDYEDGEFQLSLNAKNVPDLRVSRSYNEMLESFVANKEKNSKEQKDAVTFVKQKLDSARWFIDAIRQRHNTLLLTMNAILEHQNEYFIEGDETKMRPMILKDIAEKTDLDISTVSRVANSKYIQTHFGIFSLKSFFSEGMQNESGEEVSTREIKKILQNCIEAENKAKPLTDEKLCEILKEKGYPIARRTVAKYREQLNIPVARLRKEL